MARRMDQREKMMRRCANAGENAVRRHQAKAAQQAQADAERAQRHAAFMAQMAAKPMGEDDE